MIESGIILNNEKIGKDIWRMVIESPNIAAKATVGQFVNVRVHDNLEPLLRRPISLHGIDKDRGTIAFLYLVVGKGTEMMTKMEPRQSINLVGPLGKGFSTDFLGENALVIGGGIGSAPLYPLLQELKKNGKKAKLVLGAATDQSIVGLYLYEELEVEVAIATEDGSLGEQGFVTAIVEKELASGKYDYIYTCGPIPMLKAIEELSAKYKVAGELSTEAHMGCGLGICLSCAAKGKDGKNRKVCQDGPVFRLGELAYE
ncbi:MAG: dihydroorotate dehydrogenase electron transfer subunit [Clostridiales bacterium]